MKEEETMSVLRNENDDFKRLEEEHKKLELSLDEMLKKKYLTPDEEVEKKKIQKQKLQYKDRMAQIIRDFKQGVK
ncbi:MAG: DUF465 domain-containing protein [Nitrospirae bacterium]|nr:DUF465 domain-containing protein [Nitrospirota bacterium]